MRPIWKGTISFGLVSVPVTLYPAEERTDLQFHMLDSRDHARVRYERVNSDTGEEVPWNQVVRGFEYSDGNYVVLDEKELKKAAPKANQTIEIERFVELSEIDPVYFERPYYLEPGKGGAKGYALLREVLRDTGKAGIARVVIRLRQHIAALIARDDALVLELLRYEQELRSMDNLELPSASGKSGVTSQELKMARMLVDGMTGRWQPSDFHDEYREALTAWIKERAKTGTTPPPIDDDDDEPPPPINLMEALKRSLDTGSGQRRPAAARGPSPAAKRKPAARKTGARKTVRKAG